MGWRSISVCRRRIELLLGSVHAAVCESMSINISINRVMDLIVLYFRECSVDSSVASCFANLSLDFRSYFLPPSSLEVGYQYTPPSLETRFFVIIPISNNSWEF
jgi:hypothetical protein